MFPPSVRCKHRLRTLSMFGLRLESGDALEDVLSQLTNLRHLDLSEESPSGGADSNQDDLLGMMVSPDPMAKFRVNNFLKRPGMLPRLNHLDVSGTNVAFSFRPVRAWRYLCTYTVCRARWHYFRVVRSLSERPS